jgi:AcrR family transcriptional regulator
MQLRAAALRRPRAPRAESDSRRRLLAAAAAEFAAHGFAATTVDRIARRARVNKAMIYYHFPNKRALYTAIVREHFTPIVEKLGAITARAASPAEQIDRLIETLVLAIDESPFLPIFLREIADGAVHLGAEELGLIADVFGTVRSVIADGASRGVFRAVHPGLAHFTIIAPAVMFRATAPVRQRIKNARRIEIPDADQEMLVKHLQMVARRMLAP